MEIVSFQKFIANGSFGGKDGGRGACGLTAGGCGKQWH